MRAKCSAAADADDDDDAVTSCRISEYKHKTLPVLGYLDDVNKLDIVPVEVSHTLSVVALSRVNSDLTELTTC